MIFRDKLSIEWFDKWYSLHVGKDIDDYIIKTMRSAKEPLQFMRKALLTLKGGYFEGEPVFMDAASSAYHIMAYLLIDLKIGRDTKKINSDTRSDLYLALREQFITYLKEGDNLTPMIETIFTKRLIKRMFMPLTYGKTIKAIADDIYGVMKQYISYKTSMKLGKEAYTFWCARYYGVANLLKLFGEKYSFTATNGVISEYSKPSFTCSRVAESEEESAFASLSLSLNISIAG
ncbi:hypothetical protein L7F22_066860 [Adiantum nelumboides]|nr:hypothetical protein [Adiantum nelumboides]MCO5550125.1 hypothetical protein [Adiantum nelumboides]MCO5552832.1 hypothetical protein [Adiantum nelumboides]MCO5556518.1 hypothetical protein [Adiantum nelumboides]MCO5559967.1 hypothetical protein [Adiantum nelumboides]